MSLFNESQNLIAIIVLILMVFAVYVSYKQRIKSQKKRIAIQPYRDMTSSLNVQYKPGFMELILGNIKINNGINGDINIPKDIAYLCLKYLGFSFGNDQLFGFNGRLKIFAPNKYAWKIRVCNNVKNIIIGVSDTIWFYGIRNNGHKFVSCSSMHMLDYKHSQKNIKYCNKLKNNDVIIMILDCNASTLSYGINNVWYGVAFHSILPSHFGYRLHLRTKQPASVKLLK